MHLGQMAAEQPAKAAVNMAGTGQRVTFAELNAAAALARMETRPFYAELLPRLESIELAGRPAWAATTFVGGLKHLPIRYTLKG
jgi:hypothetical protein